MPAAWQSASVEQFTVLGRDRGKPNQQGRRDGVDWAVWRFRAAKAIANCLSGLLTEVYQVVQ